MPALWRHDVTLTPEERVVARRAGYYRRRITGLQPHAPDAIQYVRLDDIEPSPANVRLINPVESLDSLVALYQASRRSDPVVLPDPPVVRWRGEGQRFELLSGHRRTTAALRAGLTMLGVRVVTMSDEAAYRFIRAANRVASLMTIEVAYAVAEMDRLGFGHAEQREAVGEVGLDRYLRVGRAVNPAWLTDVPKGCDPSITLWGYALKAGPEHFQTCLRQWDLGLWDEATCMQQFRRPGRTGGGESYESGIRLSVNEGGRVLRFRGAIDLDMLTTDEIDGDVAGPFLQDLLATLSKGRLLDSFGEKRVTRYLPTSPD